MNNYKVTTALSVEVSTIPLLNVLTRIHNSHQPWYPHQPTVGYVYNIHFTHMVAADVAADAVTVAEGRCREQLKQPPFRSLVLLEDEIDLDSVVDKVPANPAQFMRAAGVPSLFQE